MKANSFSYLSKQGVKNLWLNRMMTLASVGVLTACLLIVGFAIVLTENIDSMVHYVESQNEFVAFMPTEEQYIEQQVANGEEPMVATADTPEGETPAWQTFVEQVRAEIEALPNVSGVTYISKEEGLESMKEQMGDYAALFDDLENDNPLNDTFTIKVKDLTKLEETCLQVQEIDGIQSVNAANDVADTLTFIRKIVNTAGGAIILALVIVSLVIIVNTIRATIFTRRKEINIMKYVGATNSFIRLPFIVEGIILGLIAAGIAYLIIWGGYSYLVQSFEQGMVPSFIGAAFKHIIPFSDIAVNLALFFGISSVGIGVVGSMISIRSHIKV
ncbi:MAG: permease-like cell division protein FtsX [Massiliimalia sp.]|jgi:cell division transport system permease protein